MSTDSIDVDRLLERHRERFRRLIQVIVAEEEGEDPFRISLAEYLRRSEPERFELVRRASTIARDRVERELRSSGAAWLVLVGDEVVVRSDDLGALPTTEEVLDHGRARDLVPYLFTAELIEELPGTAPWAPLRGVDRYPTLSMAVHPVDGDATAIVADLDTGSHITLVDHDLAGVETTLWLSGRHLGQTFFWSPMRLDCELATTAGSSVRKELPAWQVRDWATSPFVRINASRRVLVGRDLLRAFGLHLVLRADDGTTEVTEAR